MLRFIMFIIFPLVIRMWILSSKNSSNIFEISNFYDLFMTIVSVSWIIIFTYLEYNWGNSIVNFVIIAIIIKGTCLIEYDNSTGSCHVGWRSSQTVSLTNDLNLDHMLLENKFPQSKKKKRSKTLMFPKISNCIRKFHLKHRYLPATSYI